MSDLPNTQIDALRVIWSYLALSQAPEKADIIIAFGGLDLAVPTKAAELYRENRAETILVTGGKGAFSSEVHGDDAEAVTFANVLRGVGIPEIAIMIEPEATNTGENVSLSMAMLQEKGLEIRSAILVARPFLMRRVGATFNKQFPDIKVVSCPPYEDLESYLEFAGDRAVGRICAELRRVKSYPAQGYMVEQVIPAKVEAAAALLE